METNTRKVITRLEREGWVNIGGGSHDRFVKPKERRKPVTVPRHKELSVGVARQIAKDAGWLS